MAIRTHALTAAFMPWESPPLVKTARPLSRWEPRARKRWLVSLFIFWPSTSFDLKVIQIQVNRFKKQRQHTHARRGREWGEVRVRDGRTYRSSSWMHPMANILWMIHSATGGASRKPSCPNELRKSYAGHRCRGYVPARRFSQTGRESGGRAQKFRFWRFKVTFKRSKRFALSATTRHTDAMNWLSGVFIASHRHVLCVMALCAIFGNMFH